MWAILWGRVRDDVVDGILTPVQYGWTPVMAAAWGGREEIVKHLLKDCQCNVNVRDIVRPG